MGEKTKITWADSSWNPVEGCAPASAGCERCYARAFLKRIGKPLTPVLWERRLTDSKLSPVQWKSPRTVFVCSMADLFHDDVSDKYIERVYEVMISKAPRHNYLVLTKRAERMAQAWSLATTTRDMPGHIWHGVTVEDQANVWRIAHLWKVLTKRFLSLEPLLGPVKLDLRGISWVIVGGESGPGHRPMNVEWVRDIRAQCVAAKVPFFFKQWGGLHSHDGGHLLDGVEYYERPPELVRQEEAN